jgi:hypothetical protein
LLGTRAHAPHGQVCDLSLAAERPEQGQPMPSWSLARTAATTTAGIIESEGAVQRGEIDDRGFNVRTKKREGRKVRAHTYTWRFQRQRTCIRLLSRYAPECCGNWKEIGVLCGEGFLPLQDM